jgi:hypothetical protein
MARLLDEMQSVQSSRVIKRDEMQSDEEYRVGGKALREEHRREGREEKEPVPRHPNYRKTSINRKWETPGPSKSVFKPNVHPEVDLLMRELKLQPGLAKPFS